MQLTIEGRIDRPASIVIGTWDPFLEEHRALLEWLAAEGRPRGMSAVVVMLDPPPPLYVNGARNWPIFDDSAARLRLLLDTPVDAVARVHFSEEDLHCGAAEFFELLCSAVEVKEFWMRTGQSMGRGRRGDGHAMVSEGRKRNVQMRLLLPTTHTETGVVVRQHLAAGAVCTAARIVGRAPLVRRPPSGEVELAWAVGTYEARALDSTWAPIDSSPRYVELEANACQMPSFVWPDAGIEWLAFIEGPADCVQAPDEASAARREVPSGPGLLR